jgi:glycerol 3-phosphatase-2
VEPSFEHRGRRHPTRAREWAFRDYEAVRHRLPAPRARIKHHAANLDAIADQFDVFLLDAFGVLNIGETAIPGVVERVAGLKARGKQVIVVTNAAGYPSTVLHARYRRLGYDFGPDDAVSSRMALLAGLAATPPANGA